MRLSSGNSSDDGPCLRGRRLALDVGARRIGMAVSDPLGLISSPGTEHIERTGDEDRDLELIGRWIRRYDPVEVVVGLPLRTDGSAGEAARRVMAFAERVRERFAVPVVLWDERFSTVIAENALIESGVRRRTRRQVRDSVAASLILQSYLDHLRRQADRSDCDENGESGS